jgi:hypothetical protein
MQLNSRQSGIGRQSRRCVELASSLRRGGPRASIPLNCSARERSTNLGRDNSLSNSAPRASNLRQAQLCRDRATACATNPRVPAYPDRSKLCTSCRPHDAQSLEGSVQRVGEDDTPGTRGRVDSRLGERGCDGCRLEGDIASLGLTLPEARQVLASAKTSGAFRTGRQPWAAVAVLPVLDRKMPPEGLAGAPHHPRFPCPACNRTETSVGWPSRCRSRTAP